VSVGELAEKGRRGPSVNQSDLLVRSASAAVLLALALGAAYLGGVAAGIVVAIFAAIVHLEWARITGAATARTIPFAAAVAVATLLAGLGMVLAAIGVGLLAALVAAGVSREPWLPAGVVYAAALGISLLAIRVSPEFGLAALLFVLAVVWSTDSGAFFFGRLIGGPKLWPRISPKKTWVGAIGGLVTALIAGTVVARIAGIPVTPGLIAIAAFLSVACQAGDLFESWVKRHFGAKDSGHIIPGHGGMMDRVDGLIFAAVTAVLLGAVHGGANGIGRGILIW
jgi:phosphatidate cytidylyltransferase